jgi:VIT1/CCC1 family predicted Fe2+/Mn2+ transporter
MPDLFAAAIPNLAASKKSAADPKRVKLMRELEMLLSKSTFLSVGEKKKMAAVIPFFSGEIIADLIQALIRQNLRQLNKKITKS